ncbi:MAG: type II secretion system protein [Candidatus Ozemobacteraceae bacterium]|jgi:general secretion pathway protein G|nr:type II secretion system protein [Candidatus Riflebacteria bacterium]
MTRKKGFTLIELSVVVAIIGVLVAAVTPMYSKSVTRAKESALKQNLHTFRSLISDYYKDNEKWPESLDTLVKDGYLRSVPADPFTNRADTWVYVPSEEGLNDLYDVKSGAEGLSLDGKKYADF